MRLTPAIILNSSPAIWIEVPVPPDASGKSNNDAHGARRIAFGTCQARNNRQRGRSRRHTQKGSAAIRHGISLHAQNLSRMRATVRTRSASTLRRFHKDAEGAPIATNSGSLFRLELGAGL